MGNIANGSPYIGDLPPMLIALGAEVESYRRQDVSAPAAGGVFQGLRGSGPADGISWRF